MIGIEIDRLTDSILERSTGESFDTVVELASVRTLREICNSWSFDWVEEARLNSVYKLFIRERPLEVHGLISLKDLGDNIFVSLIENAPENVGLNKKYEGVAGNLFAFACKESYEKGYDGYISFLAKTALVEHYKKVLGAKQISSQLMYVDAPAAKFLIEKYYKGK